MTFRRCSKPARKDSGKKGVCAGEIAGVRGVPHRPNYWDTGLTYLRFEQLRTSFNPFCFNVYYSNYVLGNWRICELEPLQYLRFCHYCFTAETLMLATELAASSASSSVIPIWLIVFLVSVSPAMNSSG
jgi:hypothetical protein